MKLIFADEFVRENAWESILISDFDDVSVKLHWTDKPYRWHINDGEETFVVVDGRVDIHVRRDGEIQTYELRPGSIFQLAEGEEHRAEPRGQARVLVVERKIST